MKQILVVIAVVCFTSFLAYKVTIIYLPNYVYHKFYTRSMEDPGRAENEFFVLLSPDENARAVVKPNPDFSYALAFYNLEKGSLLIRGNIPDSTYWSIAFYSPNTINFHVQNDQQFKSKKLNLTLGTETCMSADVLAPTEKGLILIRYLCKEQTTTFLEKASLNLESLDISQTSCDATQPALGFTK